MKTSKTPSKKTNSSSNSQKKEVHSNEPICDICVQNVPGLEREKIYAFGKCDHYVCYVCSARLRVICDQFDCPICREKLDDVVFTSDKNRSFDKINLKSCIFNEKYKIYFENENVLNAFEKLLKYQCLECANNKHASKFTTKKSSTDVNHDFADVQGLKNHLFRAHRLKLCDLCLTHNKLFPFEYSYYDNLKLGQHMLDGEPNTSHRGHPNCKLCHNNFFNNDELIQHMSREHFHCHLCGRHDSNVLIYFLDYESLRKHFKLEHFLCERGECRHEQFTSAFDSEIDYRCHIVSRHGCTSTRGEARQQRTIVLDSAPHRSPPEQNSLPNNAAVVRTGTIITRSNVGRQLPDSIRAQLRQQRLPSGADFPALGLNGSRPVMNANQPNANSPSNNFPSLPQTSGTSSHRVTAGSSNIRSFGRLAGGGCGAPEQLDEMDFPPLPEQPKQKTKSKKVKAQPNHRPRDDGPLTLDQLINNHLTLNNNRRNGSKGGKNMKPKAIKIQL